MLAIVIIQNEIKFLFSLLENAFYLIHLITNSLTIVWKFCLYSVQAIVFTDSLFDWFIQCFLSFQCLARIIITWLAMNYNWSANKSLFGATWGTKGKVILFESINSCSFIMGIPMHIIWWYNLMQNSVQNVRQTIPNCHPFRSPNGQNVPYSSHLVELFLIVSFFCSDIAIVFIKFLIKMETI